MNKKSIAHKAIVALFVAIICLSPLLSAEPWFHVQDDSRVVYTRQDAPGLPEHYGQVGKDGLVWYSDFDGHITATYIDPANPDNILTYEPDPYGEWMCVFLQNVNYVDGLRGKAFYAPKGENAFMNEYRELNTFTPLERGSFVFWIKTDEGFIARPIPGEGTRQNFYIFDSGASGLRLRVMPAPRLMLQYRDEDGPRVTGLRDWNTFLLDIYFTSELANNLQGWNMFAFTWNTETVRFYANGIFVGEYPIPVGTLPWDWLRFGNTGSQPSRAYDEMAFYNRILSGGEIRRQYLALLKPMPDQQASLPRASLPVEIDGLISQGEWDDAVLIRGFLEGSPTGDFGTGNIADPQSELYLKYDDEHLYVACRSPWPEEIAEARLITTAMTGALTSVAKDGQQVDPAAEDAFELLISNPAAKDRIYRVLVNNNNVISDGIISGRKAGAETDFSWNSGWQVVTADEEDQWLLEAAIPLAGLGIDSAEGAALDFNITRHWNLMKKGHESWQWGRREQERITTPAGALMNMGVTGETEKIPMGRLRLTEAGNPVVRVLSIGELIKGEIDFTAEVINHGDSPAEIEVSLRTHHIDSGRDATSFLLKSETLNVKAGETVLFEFSRILEDYSDNMLVFHATSNGLTAARNSWHFIREESLDIYVKKFPAAGKVGALINCGLLAEYAPSQLSARIVITDTDGSVSASAETAPFKAYTETAVLDVSELLPGEYILSVDILADGDVVATEKQSYRHNPIPEWLGNEYGWNFNKVPPLFTAVQRDGDTLSAWHREYRFAGGILPREITTQGQELMRRPVNLIITLQDGTVIETENLEADITWNDNPVMKVVRQDEGRLTEVEKKMSPDLRREGRAVVNAGGITVTNDFWFEYDGLLWNTIKIESENDVIINGMTIEVAMAEFFSRDVLGTIRSIWVIPPQGATDIIRHIGNGYGGLQPIVRTAPTGDFMGHIQPEEAGAEYRITLLDTDTPLSQLKPLEFSLQATPVKERYPEYRKLTWSMEGSRVMFDISGTYPSDQWFLPAPDDFYRQLIIDTGKEAKEDLASFYVSGRRRSQDYSRYADYNPAPVVYSGPYFFNALNITVPEAEDFKYEWLDSPRGDERMAPGSRISRSLSGALSVRDYYMWRYGRLMDEIPFGSMYYDGMVRGSGSDHPLLSDAPGSKHPILAARELAQRKHNLVKMKFPDGIIYNHTPTSVDTALKSFTDFEADGEQLWRRHHQGMRNFSKDAMTLEEYRGKFMGHQYGWAGVWIPKLTNKAWLTRPAQRERGVAASIAEHGQSIKLLHDSSTHLWRYDFVQEYSRRLGDALERHGWGDDYLMMPYWDQHVAELPDNMYATFYVSPSSGAPAPQTFDTAGYYLRDMEGSEAEKVICIFANESDWEGEMRVKLDWKKLGFGSPEGLKVENAVHRLKVVYDDPADFSDGTSYSYEEDTSEYARIEGGEVIFPMTAWNYRMIVIERP